MAQEFITTKEKALEALKARDYYILSAENPHNRQLPPMDNWLRLHALMMILREEGYEPVGVIGKYNHIEHSLLVPDLPREEALNLAAMFDQESVAGKEGLLLTDGRVQEAAGEPYEAPDAKDYYSRLIMDSGEELKFQIPLVDWISTPQDHV